MFVSSIIFSWKKDDSHGTSNDLWLEMFGYRFIDNESILNTTKPIQLIDYRSMIPEKKSKRIHSISSYDQSSFFRFVLD